jgi:hypothetical protein
MAPAEYFVYSLFKSLNFYSKTEHSKKTSGLRKRKKTYKLEIYETFIPKIDNVPPGTTFKGNEELAVHDAVIVRVE